MALVVLLWYGEYCTVNRKGQGRKCLCYITEKNGLMCNAFGLPSGRRTFRSSIVVQLKFLVVFLESLQANCSIEIQNMLASFHILSSSYLLDGIPFDAK